jgi:hypothetical protein
MTSAFRGRTRRNTRGIAPSKAVSMLTILLATCETTLSTLRAADNPVDRELTGLLERMVDRTRDELQHLASDRTAPH